MYICTWLMSLVGPLYLAFNVWLVQEYRITSWEETGRSGGRGQEEGREGEERSESGGEGGRERHHTTSCCLVYVEASNILTMFPKLHHTTVIQIFKACTQIATVLCICWTYAYITYYINVCARYKKSAPQSPTDYYINGSPCLCLQTASVAGRQRPDYE